jgi:hypothetical protein
MSRHGRKNHPASNASRATAPEKAEATIRLRRLLRDVTSMELFSKRISKQVLSIVQPPFQVLPDERIIIEIGIGTINPIDLLRLPRAKFLIRIKTPGSFEQTLTPENFVNARNAPGEVVRGVKNRSVRVRQLVREPQQIDGNLSA